MRYFVFLYWYNVLVCLLLGYFGWLGQCCLSCLPWVMNAFGRLLELVGYGFSIVCDWWVVILGMCV